MSSSENTGLDLVHLCSLLNKKLMPALQFLLPHSSLLEHRLAFLRAGSCC